MTTSKMHVHPSNSDLFIYGTKLVPGDVIESSDVYDSNVGKWSEPPSPCVGMVVQEGWTTYWVRPEK